MTIIKYLLTRSTTVISGPWCVIELKSIDSLIVLIYWSLWICFLFRFRFNKLEYIIDDSIVPCRIEIFQKRTTMKYMSIALCSMIAYFGLWQFQIKILKFVGIMLSAQYHISLYAGCCLLKELIEHWKHHHQDRTFYGANIFIYTQNIFRKLKCLQTLYIGVGRYVLHVDIQ